MRVSVYGCGLTGLVTAWALADVGNDVVAVCCDCEDIARVREGRVGFEEPGLSEKLLVQQQSGRLRITDRVQEGVDFGSVHFLALGSDQIVLAETLVTELAEAYDGVTVVNQSTFPVGTSGRLRALMQSIHDRRGVEGEIHFLALPSVLQEGAAITNFTRPHRIIVGADEAVGLQLLQELLRPFSRNHEQLIVMSTRAAEFTKYAINGMLATKLSFMNEMANLADQLQVDIEQVRKGVGSDPRIGHDYIYPGCGFGGLSFSEDLITLAETVEQQVEDSNLLQTVLETNRQQKEVLFRKLWRYWETELKGKTVAVWGGSFKPNTDSIDNAPSLPLLEALWAQGVKVRLYDPKAMSRIQDHYGPRDDLELCINAYDAAQGADALMIVTEWKEFWSPDFERLRQLLSEPLIFDGRNLFDPSYMKHLGFQYFGVGRNSAFV